MALANVLKVAAGIAPRSPAHVLRESVKEQRELSALVCAYNAKNTLRTKVGPSLHHRAAGGIWRILSVAACVNANFESNNSPIQAGIAGRGRQALPLAVL